MLGSWYNKSIGKVEVECYLFMLHPTNFASFKHEIELNVTFDPYQATISLLLTSKCFNISRFDISDH